VLAEEGTAGVGDGQDAGPLEEADVEPLEEAAADVEDIITGIGSTIQIMCSSSSSGLCPKVPKLWDAGDTPRDMVTPRDDVQPLSNLVNAVPASQTLLLTEDEGEVEFVDKENEKVVDLRDDSVLFELLKTALDSPATGPARSATPTPRKAAVQLVMSLLRSRSVLPAEESVHMDTGKMFESPLPSKMVLRSSKKVALRSSQRTPDTTTSPAASPADLTNLQELEPVGSTTFYIFCFTFLLFVGVGICWAKVIGLSSEAAVVFTQLISLWVSMMLCLFGFHLLNKAVTKVYRPHPARRVLQVNVL
jgi:hypothetical protein